MITALVEVILPVVLVASVGYVIARRFTLHQQTLSKVQLYGLTPALAFSSLMKMHVSAEATVRLAATYALATVIAGVLAALAGALLRARNRRVMIACTIIGNNGNFGLPVALLSLGQAGLDMAVLIFLFSLVVMWTAGPALLGGHRRPADMVKAIASLPVTWALLAAVLIRTTGVHPPKGILTAIELLAGAAIPMVLMSLGIQLAVSQRIHLTGPTIATTVLRVLGVPIIAYVAGRVCGLSGLPLQSIVLAFAMPTAVNTFMLSLEYGAEPDTVASVVALTTLVSVLTLALVVANLPLLA